MTVGIDIYRWRKLRSVLSSAPLVELAKAETVRVQQSWDDLSAEDVVRSLLVQVAVIGNARTGYRFDSALREPNRMTHLLELRNVGPSLHAIARNCGVRFVGEQFSNAKVKAWCSIVERSRASGNIEVFRAELAELCRWSGRSLIQDRTVRERLVALGLPMLGQKSWSDWLNNRGMTRHLLAIDTRMVGVWRRELKASIRLENFQTTTEYLAWEDACNTHLANPLGITLSELDKRLFMLPTLRPPRP
jgi:hypothetical protein